MSEERIEIGSATLYLGDCRDVMATLPSNSIDACVCDPPYELGFMGRAWDRSGVAYDVEVWRQVLRLLKPGGHLLAFGGTRTYHRLTSAVEDAGFEIRDQIGWLYGTGFPKSKNLKDEFDGWGTALKPAWEPIVVARKPIEGTVESNAKEWRTGPINIDACRIPGSKPDTTRGAGGQHDRLSPIKAQGRIKDDGRGRWPANVIHDGSDEVEIEFAKYGESKSSDRIRNSNKSIGDGLKYRGGASIVTGGHSDSGTASRFFYCAKPSKRERGESNTHPTVKPIALARYLCRLVTPTGGVVLTPFLGSGTEAIGATIEGFRAIGIEKEREYLDIARQRIEAYTTEEVEAQGELFAIANDSLA